MPRVIRNLAVCGGGAIAYLSAAPLAFVLLLVAVRPFELEGVRKLSILEYIQDRATCENCAHPLFIWQTLMFGLCSLFVVAIAYGISRGVSSRGLLAGTLLVLPAVALFGVIPFVTWAYTNAGEWTNWFYTFAALPLALLGSWLGGRRPRAT